MAKRLRPEEWWSVLIWAAVGAILGVLLSTIWHLLHDHSDLTAEQALWGHFVPRMLAVMVGGAIVFGRVSAIRSRLKRRE